MKLNKNRKILIEQRATKIKREKYTKSRKLEKKWKKKIKRAKAQKITNSHRKKIFQF